MSIRITSFEQEYAPAFEKLNREWLVKYGLLEEADEPHLRDPQTHILDKGGAILVALENDEVSGTCAVVPEHEGVFELVKLAVSPSAQGKGLGRRLVQKSIEVARAFGAKQLVLLSSSKLQPAIRLYEQLGFRHEPLPPSNPYATADVYMVLDL